MSDPRVDSYIQRFEGRNEIIKKLRNLFLTFDELEECVKWNMPVYTFQKKNLIGFAVFKHFTSVWFYEGVLLKDEAKKLVNAQKGKTHALRQWRFTSTQDFDEDLLNSYIKEAIELARSGKKVETKKSKIQPIPPELKEAFSSDSSLKKSFFSFTAYKQKEFIEYLSEAKRENTRLDRLEKIIPMIKSGTGLHDKYRK